MKFQHVAAAALLTTIATPAFAQETDPPAPVTVSGSVALVSDYRFRGVSQSDKEMAIQGGITVAHESGLYVGTWGSNLAGWGTFGGANIELDLIAGYKMDLGGGAALDAGVTWFMYPGGADKTDFAELFLKASTSLGPVSVLGGVAYAPKQEALGNWSFTGANAQDVLAGGAYDDEGAKDDNLYIWGDISSAIPETPVTLKAHLGYSDGNPGLGPNGTSVAPTGKYLDWLIGADVALGPVTLGVAYVDTDIKRADAAYLLPNFSSTKDGSPISDSKVVVSLTAAF